MEVGSVVIALRLAMEQFRRDVDDARRQSRTFADQIRNDFRRATDEAAQGNQFERLGRAATVAGAGITTAGLAMGAALGAAVKTSADFGAQMSKVQAISGASVEEFKKLKDTAIQLGASTSFSSKEVAAGMQELAAAGMDTNQILGAMPGVLSAAAASGEDMSLVSETMATALNTFGLGAEQSGRVADVLAQAANMSAIGVRDMAYTFKYAAPVAAQLGYSLESVSAAAALMGNAGIKGEQAGTTLRASFLRLVDPPKEAAETIDKLGLSITDNQGKMRPLGDLIGQLEEKTRGMTEAQKAATMAQLFGTEAVSGMMVLLAGGKSKFDEMNQAMIDSTGASKKAADIMKDNLKGSLDQLSGAVESAFISIGDALAPSIRVVADAIAGMIAAFNSLPEGAKKTIALVAAAFTALALVVGPLLLLVGFLPSIVAGFGLVSAALGPVAAGFTALWAAITGPIGLVVAAIIGIALAVRYVAAHFDEIEEAAGAAGKFVMSVFDAIGKALDNALQYIIGLFMQYHPIGIIMSHWTEIKQYFVKVAADARTWGRDIVLGIVNGIKGKIGEAVAAARELGGKVASTIKDFFHISSPSRLMFEYGENVGAGLAGGINASANEVEAASNKMAAAAAAGMGNLRSVDVVKPITASMGDLRKEEAKVEASFGSLRREEKSYHDESQKNVEKTTKAVNTWAKSMDGVKAAAKSVKDAVSDMVDKAMSKLELALSVTEKEFRVLELSMGRSATTMDKLGIRKESLAVQFGLLTKELSVLEEAYNKIAGSKGKQSEDALKIYERLLDTKIRTFEVSKELTDTAANEARIRQNMNLLQKGAASMGIPGVTAAGMATGKVTNITVNNYGTKAESADRATYKELQKLQYLGAFGQ